MITTTRLGFAVALSVAAFSAKPAVAGPYSDAILASGPLAYYRLDETVGPTAANIGSATGINAAYVNIGAELNASMIGAVGPQPGSNAGAYLIDGFEANNRSLLLSPTVGSTATSNTFPRAEVAVPDDSATNPLVLTGGFTLEAWIRHSGDTIDPGNHEGIVGRYRQNQNGAARSYVLYYDSTAETADGVGAGLGIAFSPDGAFSAANSVEFKGPINVGEWAHVAAVYEPGARMELYVNGMSIGQVDGVISDPLYSGEGDLWIGQQFTGADEWSFQGNIDEVAVYNRPLSDSEISNHFAAATANTPIFFSWDQNASGDWNEAANWTLDTIPNTNERTAIFGGAITSPRVVYTNAATTVKGMRFAGENGYAVSGTGTINLSAASGNASIEVAQGEHEVQAAVTLGSNTDVDASGGSIDFNNALNLGSRTLNIESGRVNINHSVVAGTGGLIINAATVGTAGATAIDGNLTSTGVLDVDLGGTGVDEFDAFQISGTATLSGLLDVELVNGFTLSGSESFTVVSAGMLVNNGITLTGSAANMLNLAVVGNSLVLSASSALDGDYNGNGVVDAADYVVWRKTDGTPNGYSIWRTNFGRTSGSGSLANIAVPEPVSLTLVLLTALLMGIGRRKKLLTSLPIAVVLLLAASCATRPVFAGPYSDAVVADNPLVYYRFEEPASSFIASNSGTGGFGLDGFYNQFTETSGPRSLAQPGPRPGDIAGGYTVDGVEASNLTAHWGPAPSDYTRVQVDDTDALDISTTGLTLEAWVNRDPQTDTGANEGIIAKYLGTGNQRSYNLYYDPTPGVIGLALSTSGANQTAFTLQTTTNIPIGEWTHVAATWVPGQSMHIYFNGQEVANRADVQAQTAVWVGTAPLWIGQQFNTAPGSTFEGRIDEAAVYDRALSAVEILEHFQAATGAFVGTYSWNVNGSGDWNAPGNWNPDSVPNSNQSIVNFGNVVTSPQTVYTETAVTAKTIQFTGLHKYAIAGHGDIVLSADSGNASILVTQGNHEFQAPVRLASDTNVNVAAGSITFNNVLNLDGNTLDIEAGTVHIRNDVIPGPGGMVTNAGTLALDSDTLISGDLTSSGVLAFEIGGSSPEQFDGLHVGGTAIVSGAIYVTFSGNFMPARGESFRLITADELVDQGIVLARPLGNHMRLIADGNSLVLHTVAIPESATLVLFAITASIIFGFTRRRWAAVGRSQ